MSSEPLPPDVLEALAGDPVPALSLDTIAATPEVVMGLAPEVAWELYTKAVGVVLILLPAVRPRGNPGAEEERLLTPPEAAAQLGVRPSRIYQLIRTGALPVVRVGKYVRVRVTALNQWVAEHEKALYPALSPTYNIAHDRQGAPKTPPKARMDPGPARPRNRNSPELPGQAGERRTRDLVTGRSARPDAGGRRPAPAPPDDDSDETKW